MITVIKPKACKYCEHWGPNPATNHNGICQFIVDADIEVSGNEATIEAFAPSGLVSGPDFYCYHFKEKGI